MQPETRKAADNLIVETAMSQYYKLSYAEILLCQERIEERILNHKENIESLERTRDDILERLFKFSETTDF